MTWQGKTVAVCGSGPSLTPEVAEVVRALGVPVIVTNDSWRRLPDAEVLFAANASWWKKRNPRVSPTAEEFAGERIVCEDHLIPGVTFVPPRSVRIGGNSALRACHLAEDRGAAKILLFGVDLREDELTHWHGLHRGLDNPNWTTFKRHRAAWDEYALSIHRPEVINMNQRSALDCFPKASGYACGVERLTVPIAIPARRRAVVFQGMHGIGDSLHERAIVRELKRAHEVWVRTSWPQILWDMPEVHLSPLASPIPWMAANERRCAHMYSTAQIPADARTVRCAYPWPDAKGTSVLAAMSKYCGVPVGDFRLPVALSWAEKAERLLAQWRPTRPLLITRPLLAISDSNPRSAKAKLARNPDAGAYRALLAGLRDRYFVISVADARPGVEWITTDVDADVHLHRGELDFETMAGLTARAALVYTSPCFLTVLAQAVETPLVCVFGGFERKGSFSSGARYSPWLPIEPINPCGCWTWNCRHDKTIAVAEAAARIEEFIDAQKRPISEPHKCEDTSEALTTTTTLGSNGDGFKHSGTARASAEFEMGSHQRRIGSASASTEAAAESTPL